jgi:glutamate N-acetyltransferase/amino-acid N-acetyltransferase
VNLPLGFSYAATHAGLRKDPRNDVALIVSDAPASAAAMFTRNRVQAAPVRLARTHLHKSHGLVKAVLVNAGNANCATQTGDAVAAQTCAAVARALSVPVEQIFPASTGVIGVEMEPQPILRALPALTSALSPDHFGDVADAILTTDTRRKIASAEVQLKGGVVRIAGITKGAGMIHPRMATTLAFVVTDAEASPFLLQAMLTRSISETYNRISIDGDTSTNDTALLLASGRSGVKIGTDDRPAFQRALTEIFESLAEQIVRDGEGARKLIVIDVSGAADEASAERIARAIANSPLFRTAIAGSDPNWGRILSAAGNSGVEFDPAQVDIRLQDVGVCAGGVAAEFSEDELKRKLDEPEVSVEFSIRGSGAGRVRFRTCDLTEKYIEINASYRT